ncbi:MAG: Mur ligase family protein [Thermodesulfovibrionia bacterium]|nr:Mur ligase family protein [Thermodesulfovibrionia bacterium]
MTIDSKQLKIFFSGIGGSGVSAIAGFMAGKGHNVAGSDRAFDENSGSPLKKTLQSSGIRIFSQDGSGIDAAFDLVVFSTAVENDSPELLKAKKLGVRVRTRPEFLTEITNSHKTIAVAGTSGKSTTAAMLAFLMERLGLDPNYIGGGRARQFRSETNPGNYLSGSSDHLVIEACESDGTIVNYRPRYSIILNLSLDHHTVAKTADMFKELIKHTGEKVIINADDENLAELKSEGVTTFSIDSLSDYRAEAVKFMPFGTDFLLRGTRFSLSLPGKYNLYNAVSCIALLLEIGISPALIAAALPEFQGIERRFDIHFNDGKKLVIDDYAHNPHKIAALMETVMRLHQRICYIFQPHGFGPTKLMKDEYIEVFSRNLRDTDHLIILPIYYAGGSIVRDISSLDLAAGISEAGRSVEVIEDRAEILNRIDGYSAYVIFGARDETLSDLAEQVAKKVKNC